MQVKSLAVALSFLAIGTASGFTQEVVLSIGHTCANAGDSIVIQVNLDNTVGDEVNVAEITIDFDTSVFEVTDVSRTERTRCHDLFLYSHREEGILVVFTNFCVVTPGTGPIADIHVKIAYDAENGMYDWTLTETILSDLLGVEIPHVTSNGTFTIPCEVNVRHVHLDVPPDCFGLSQNYPNPFNLATDIKYQIPDNRYPVQTTLKIFNILGQEVRVLVDEIQEAGYHSVTWDR